MSISDGRTWSQKSNGSTIACIEEEHEPVPEDEEEMYNSNQCSWQLLSVSLHRAPTLGFGIAISGGRDNPHFTSGDPVVVISDVVPNGPAWGLLQVNDRILSANNVSFENIDYATAVDIIKNKDHINMIVKRRVAMPMLEFEQRTLKFTLSKSRKKDDFGIVVGCKFYIKEIRNPKLAEKDPGLKEGDAVLRVNGQSLEGATLEEVNKWLERSRDKLCLVIQRDVRRGTSTSRWPSQNTVYERVGSVTATPRHSPSPMLPHMPISARNSHEYVNSPKCRPDGSVERRVSSPAISQISNVGMSASMIQQQQQQSQGSYQNGQPQEYEYYTRQSTKPAGDNNGIRNVVFRKVGGSVGVRVIGGNEVGIFVSAVAADSPAAMHGVCCGDKILEVNGRNMRGITREAAVQLLLGLDDRVSLVLEHSRAEFEHVRGNQLGDNFYIRSHFTKEKKSSQLELSVNEGDIFHVTDTLFGGTVGLWQAARVYSAAENKGEPVKGVIPNQATSEIIAKEYRATIEAKQARNNGTGGGTLLRRKLDSRRGKSLAKNMICDPTEIAANVPLPAYERVALNTPSFHRPIVLFGPLADIARQQLLSQFSARFAQPDSDGGVIRLSSVDHVIASMKHCILDISIESVERLQLSQYAPIVVLLDVDGRSKIREIRKKANAPHLSSRKLAEHSAQIKKYHSHLLSATIDATHETGWFDALRELIVHLQQRRLWMPEFPPNLPLEDVLLFPLPKCDGDVDSLKSEYIEYNTSRRDDSSLPRSLKHQPNDPMTKSIYNWETSNAATSASNSIIGSTTLDPAHQQQQLAQYSHHHNQLSSHPHHSELRMVATLPRRPPISDDYGGARTRLSSSSQACLTASTHQQNKTTFIPTTPNNKINELIASTSSSHPNASSPALYRESVPSRTTSTSPGYYHVKQILDDESLYQDARLANEIANARLREEAKLREERVRDDIRAMNSPSSGLPHRLDDQQTTGIDSGFSNSSNGSTSNNSSAKYHPLTPSSVTSSSSTTSKNQQTNQQTGSTRPTLAPKPSLYTDSYIRNRWNNDNTMDARGNAVIMNGDRQRLNGSASPATTTASISLAVGNLQNGLPPSKSPTPRLDENDNGKPTTTGLTGRVEASEAAAAAATTTTATMMMADEDEPIVVEESTGLIGSKGGIIRCEQSNVELIIPEGAIKNGQEHEIYVKVCREGESSPIDRSKGETLLSPLVMCGPQGLQFDKECELRMPHTGPLNGDSDGQWSFSLKTGEGGEWKHMDIEQSNANDEQFLCVPITHF